MAKQDGNGPRTAGLTTRQGHPVFDNQNTRSVGERGPLVLEDYQFLEKITHFDRERIPERVVHARGAAAHGYFEPYGTAGGDPIEKYTRAKVFRKGTRTPVFIRFSTVIHGGHSPETLRDPRGFAIKFYTEAGNWDLVGNNLKVFFIRDPLKFPDMVHAFKPDPVHNRQSMNRFFDFVSLTPEATHMVTWLFSPWGIPATYREMQGSGVNTYKLVNDKGETVLVKFHFQPKQGVRNLTQKEAEAIQAKDFNHATGDLYDAIERGDFPEWEMAIQVMEDHEHAELDWDPLDVTKLWPEDQFPLLPVGRVVLDRNPVDYHNEVEQVAFGTGVLVDGIDFSDDKLLQGRTFAYSDTQRYRVGPNYLQLPINAPKCPFATNQRGGQMSYHVDGAEQGADPHVNYEPSNRNGLREQERAGPPPRPYVEGHVGRQPLSRPNNYKQADERYRTFSDAEREELISNLVGALSECDRVIQEKMVHHFTQADPDYGARVAQGLGLRPSQAAAE
jgi:catalase